MTIIQRILNDKDLKSEGKESLLLSLHFLILLYGLMLVEPIRKPAGQRNWEIQVIG